MSRCNSLWDSSAARFGQAPVKGIHKTRGTATRSSGRRASFARDGGRCPGRGPPAIMSEKDRSDGGLVRLSSASRSLGVFAMLMAGLFWGGSGTISRFAPAAALDQPLALAWTRLFFGGVMLGAAALAVRRRGSGGSRRCWALPAAVWRPRPARWELLFS